MRCTNTKLRIHGLKRVEEPDLKKADTFYLCNLEFELHEEDFRLLREVVNWINGNKDNIEFMKEMPAQDEADFLLSAITHHIHRWKEVKDQEPFTLRMDRKGTA